jgi:HAD superfamily hydrolase (TIGR01549 family)
MKPVLVFDFDGTLMDTTPAIFASFRHVFAVYRTAQEFTPEKEVQVLGPSLQEIMPRFFPDEDPAEVIDEYRRYQREEAQHLIHPFPHVVKTLQQFQQEGYPMGILSVRMRDSLTALLEAFDMARYFDFLFGYQEVRRQKPEPDGIYQAMAAAGRDRAVYVGDSWSDVEAGKRAGALTIAMLSEERKRASLLACHPDAVITDLNQMGEILARKGYNN